MRSLEVIDMRTRSLAEPMALSPEDVAYVRTNFVPLNEACRARGRDPRGVRQSIRTGRLPGPPYVLPDGIEMVPSTYFEQIDAAGGGEPSAFQARYRLEAERLLLILSPDEPATVFNEWLSGLYFVCLRQATPENVARKRSAIERIESLVAHPRPSDPSWLTALAAQVDELDRLERDFAAYDRLRFGGPSSRDLLIDDVRRRYLETA
jgi:hypothetical protein